MEIGMMREKIGITYEVISDGTVLGEYVVKVLEGEIDTYPSDVASDAAKHFHDYHDGWELKWPLDIRLHHPDTDDTITFEIDRISVPEFEPTGSEKYD